MNEVRAEEMAIDDIDLLARITSDRSDAMKRLAYAFYRHYLKPIALERYLQHIANSVVVVGQQNSRHRPTTFSP